MRDVAVTGVQTCALPIFTHAAPAGASGVRTLRIYRFDPDSGANPRLDTFRLESGSVGPKIGRASCRGREEISAVAASLKKKKKKKSQQEYLRTYVEP